MPELPEVETTRRGLLAAVQGQGIREVIVHRYDLRTPIPHDLPEILEGARIMDVRRRAKYLLLDLDCGQVVLVHLGMSGSLRVCDAQHYVKKKHDHVVIHLENNHLVVFHDPRRFGMMEVMLAADEAHCKPLAKLGPEPLEKEFSAKYLAAALARRNTPIKVAIMDQQLVVGVGNIYASESLYLCGIHPSIPARDVAGKSAELIAAIRQVLLAAIDSGGSTLRDFVGADSADGYFQHQFQVYGRAGKPCFSCGNFIENAVYAGRATYWCPHCQPL